MLADHHPGVQDYKQAFELTRHMPQEQQFGLSFTLLEVIGIAIRPQIPLSER